MTSHGRNYASCIGSGVDQLLLVGSGADSFARGAGFRQDQCAGGCLDARARDRWDGAAAREDQTVIISKGKIESVSDASSANVPKDAQVLDLHGYSVIPGLVGMHDHMFYPMGNGVFGEMAFSFPRLYLAGGVTTIRTTGSLEPYTDLELKKSIDAGESPGPKMHVTGPYLEGKGSWAIQLHQLTGPEDATQDGEFLARPGRR